MHAKIEDLRQRKREAYNAGSPRSVERQHEKGKLLARERIQALHQQAYGTGEPWQVIERIVRPDGELRALLGRARLFFDETGSPVRMLGVVQDVTARRRAEDALRARRRWWSLQPVRQPAVPPVQDEAWPADAVDHFILARLEREGLQPSPETDRVALVRRVSLDLTGLPPTPAEIAARKGTSSRCSKRSRFAGITGKSMCESAAVSPCPGKCFAVASMPLSWMPIVSWSGVASIATRISPALVPYRERRCSRRTPANSRPSRRPISPSAR